MSGSKRDASYLTARQLACTTLAGSVLNRVLNRVLPTHLCSMTFMICSGDSTASPPLLSTGSADMPLRTGSPRACGLGATASTRDGAEAEAFVGVP